MINSHENIMIEDKVRFYEEILNTIPATFHVLKVDRDFNTLPIWTNATYEQITGLSLAERQSFGYAGTQTSLYHPDDIKSIKKGIQYLIKNPDEHTTIFFRILTKNNKYKWLYMLAKLFKRTKDYYTIICLGIDVNNKLAFNKRETNLYIKELSRLKNQIELNKLTKTEKKVIEKYAHGLSTKEVASKLNRSYETINNHKRNIFKKLGFHKITELVGFAEECGLD